MLRLALAYAEAVLYCAHPIIIAFGYAKGIPYCDQHAALQIGSLLSRS